MRKFGCFLLLHGSQQAATVRTPPSDDRIAASGRAGWSMPFDAETARRLAQPGERRTIAAFGIN
jgi:hypothetical protein